MDKQSNFLEKILGIYVVLIGVGLPIAVKNRYFDILVAKYYYYCFCTILMLVIILIYSLTIGRKRIVLYLKQNALKTFASKISKIEFSVLIFLLIAIISTISSDYLFESFWGNEGRFTGLFLMTWYVLSYFCISRFWKFKKIYIDIILITGIFVCLFGITDYFQLDIFHFKAPMLAEQRPIFTSTIGNINTYTAYVGIIMAIATVLFALSKNYKCTIFYYICMIISFFAIIMGVSDNAYLSLAALFGFLPLYLFNSKNGIRRYLIILATFFSVIMIIGWINTLFENEVLGLDSAVNVIINSGVLQYLAVGLWAVILLWYFMDYKIKSEDKEYGNIFRNIWVGLIILTIFAIVYILYDFNIRGNEERYGELSNYLLFNDEWGTHRGYIWRNAMECYMKFSTWKKLIGFGPETFGILLLQQTRNNPYNQLFDSAHNEYLHLLVTVGIAGLTAYLTFIFAFIKRCFSYKKKNSYVIAIAFGVICYSVQAFVNLNLPIVTPILWLLLGMGGAKSVGGE